MAGFGWFRKRMFWWPEDGSFMGTTRDYVRMRAVYRFIHESLLLPVCWFVCFILASFLHLLAFAA